MQLLYVLMLYGALLDDLERLGANRSSLGVGRGD